VRATAVVSQGNRIKIPRDSRSVLTQKIVLELWGGRYVSLTGKLRGVAHDPGKAAFAKPSATIPVISIAVGERNSGDGAIAAPILMRLPWVVSAPGRLMNRPTVRKEGRIGLPAQTVYPMRR